jgi:hypothetical protein
VKKVKKNKIDNEEHYILNIAWLEMMRVLQLNSLCFKGRICGILCMGE